MNLRTMRWWDVESLLPVERELFGVTAWSRETFWSELAHPETRWYVVAFDGDEFVGYAGLLAPGMEADVQTIAVAPAAQGRGIGGQLLDALITAARERGSTSLMLEVRADNAPAVNLYAKRCFEQIAVRRRYYQPGDVDALIMRLRPLSAAPPGPTDGPPPA